MRRAPVALAAAALVAAQALRCERSNPPITGDLDAPPAVAATLRRACYDCHSHETRWPWYAGLAPVSWLVHRDVSEGRRRLDFSSWDAYAQDPGTRLQKLEHLRDSFQASDMPPWYYRLVHPEARLRAADRALLARWAADEIAAARALPPDGNGTDGAAGPSLSAPGRGTP